MWGLNMQGLRASAVIVAVVMVCFAGSVQAQLIDVTQPGDPIQVVSGTNDQDTAFGPPPAAEGVANAIDNTTNKYLNFLDFGSGFIVTPRFPSVVRGIRLFSANDASERDPASFILEGSNSPTGPFSVIYGSNVTLPGDRNPTGRPLDSTLGTQYFETLIFNNNTTYTNYRVTFPTLRDGVRAVGMQIAEVELLGRLIPEPASLGLLAFSAMGLLARRRRA